MAKSDSAGMKLVMGDLGLSSRSLRQYKVTAIELRENELDLAMRRGAMRRGDRPAAGIRFKLKGIIGCKDSGVVGKPLDRYRIEDMGSHKVIALERANGVSAFRCSYMEGEML